MKYDGHYTGVVVDNNDPLELGRLKVWVPAIHGQEGDAKQYPWATRVIQYGGVVKENSTSVVYGSYMIPRIGTQVLIIFEYGRIDRPMVLGCMLTKKVNEVIPYAATRDEDISAEYPDVLVLKLPTGDESGYVKFTANREKGEFKAEISASETSFVKMVKDASGTVSINVLCDQATIQVNNQLQVVANGIELVNNDPTKTLMIYSQGDLDISGVNVTVSAQKKLQGGAGTREKPGIVRGFEDRGR